MSNLPRKIASILAFVIGALAILAGGAVLLGRDPGYTVIDWLPPVNLLVGLVSCFVTAILIWKGSRLAQPAALLTLGLHALVMLLLLAAYRREVARESLVAMALRIFVWLVILALLRIAARVQIKRHLLKTGGFQ